MRVINFGEEEGIDFVDLSQYVVSDLGCINTPTGYKKPVITSNKKNDTNKSSIDSTSKTCKNSTSKACKKHSFSYKRNRN